MATSAFTFCGTFPNEIIGQIFRRTGCLGRTINLVRKHTAGDLFRASRRVPGCGLKSGRHGRGSRA